MPVVLRLQQNPSSTRRLCRHSAIHDLYQDPRNAHGILADGEVIEATALTMDNYVKILPLILQLPASIAYILLKSCINPRPIHLLRTVEPVLTKDPIKAFDDLIDRGLHILLKKIEPFANIDILTLDQVRDYEALPTQASLVRSLPANGGGHPQRQ